jgi:hypothetical protein
MVLALLSFCVHAETSYHFLGPVSGMYDLPVGESAGWSSSTWFNLELTAGSIWNHGAHFTDTRNHNDYYLFADYEQETAVAEIGQALTQNIAVAVEVPYVNHNGGFMDDFVDQFHTFIQSDRFMRDSNPKFGNHMVVQTNGVNQLSSEHAEGAGNMKAKLKYWMYHLNSPTPGACDCGLAVSGQVKFPLQSRLHGLTSGQNDYSGLIHLGIPFASNSGIMTTAAFTKLGRNDTFQDWPMRTWQQMYELDLHLGLGKSWSVILQARAESPLFNKQYLNFTYTTTDDQEMLEERVASGWNSLVEWRGNEDIRFRYSWGKGSYWDFGFVEDWGIGSEDQATDGLYVNNAPDFQFMTTMHFSF